MDTTKEIKDIVTKDELVEFFHSIGITKGSVVEVHSALSSFNFVVGDAQSVVDALIEAVGAQGTIVMPCQYGNNSDPGAWVNPPLDLSLVKDVRDNIPAYNSVHNETRLMGRIVENLRRREGVVYSNHPTAGYIAYGRYAHLICNRQSLHFGLGEDSPTARLCELKSMFLCIGVGINNLTCAHLAEYRAESRPIEVMGSMINISGNVKWKSYLDYALDADDFMQYQEEFIETGIIKRVKVHGSTWLYGQVDTIVDALTQKLDESSPLKLYYI